jgi:hypothetical protein
VSFVNEAPVSYLVPGKENDAFLLCWAAAIAHINSACFRLPRFWLFQDILRAFHGYLLPSVSTTIWYLISNATTTLPNCLTIRTSKFQ